MSGRPSGPRLAAAFAAVAVFAVLVLTVAAFVATDQGLRGAERTRQEHVANQVAAAASGAFTVAGGWQHAGLGDAATLATGGGASLVVTDTRGAVVWPPGGTLRGGDAEVRASVSAGGQLVGTVHLAFAGGQSAGRGVAWSWLFGAALLALAGALLLGTFLARRMGARAYPS